MRLTEAQRRAICHKALAHALDADQAKLNADWARFGDDIYKDAYAETDRRRMARLPRGWLPEVDGIKAQFGSDILDVAFFSKRRIPNADGDENYWSRRVVKQYSATHVMSQRATELTRRKEAMKDRRADLNAKVMATLHSVQTVKRLHEVWPESKQFTDGMSFEIANLPALPIKALNKLLGLEAA